MTEPVKFQPLTTILRAYAGSMHLGQSVREHPAYTGKNVRAEISKGAIPTKRGMLRRNEDGWSH